MFQFQTGAIKSERSVFQLYPKPRFNSKLVRLKEVTRRSLTNRSVWFQFQTGAIKSVCPSVFPLRAKAGFNSKLVRLKAAESGADAWRAWTWFQFQTGAIKRRKDWRSRQSGQTCFNSKLVRLKGLWLRENRAVCNNVSIPNWCD